MKAISKNLIRTLVIIAMITCGLGTQAQPDVKFGLKAGVNANTIGQNFANEDYEFDTEFQIGFHAGVMADINFGGPVSLQPGLIFNSKGTNYNIEEWAEEGHDRLRLNYLDIPVNIAYEVGDGFKLFAGPYVALGISGKNEWDVESSDGINETGETKMVFKFGEVDPKDIANDEEPLRALDFGANVGAMYEFGPAFVNVIYMHGFGNLTPKVMNGADPADFKKHIRTVMVGAGVYLQ